MGCKSGGVRNVENIRDKKKTNQIRVWTAVDRNRLKFADFVVGGASKEVCKSLLDCIVE